MIFIHVGNRLVRTKDLRIDGVRFIREDEHIETTEEREARVAQKGCEIQQELKHQKPNKFGLI